MEIYLDTPRTQLHSKHNLVKGYEIFDIFPSVLPMSDISYFIKHKCCSSI